MHSDAHFTDACLNVELVENIIMTDAYDFFSFSRPLIAVVRSWINTKLNSNRKCAK